MESSDSSGGGDQTQQQIAQFIFLVLGLVVGIGGFIWAKRTGRYITRWRAVISPLSFREKKNVRRQIVGKAPVDHTRLPIILAIAKQNQRASQALTPIYGALSLFVLSSALGTEIVFSR